VPDKPSNLEPRSSNLTVQGYPARQADFVPRRVLGIQHLAQWKNDPEQANGWLCRIIGSAFQSFIITALPGQPAAEMLPLTAQLWVDDLADMGMNEEQDRDRLEAGLRKLRRTLQKWPQIADLIEAMPHRETVSRSNEVKVQAGVSEAGQQAGLEALAKMKKEMGI